MDIIRESYLKTLEKRVREVRPLLQVLLGPRQIGKTTLALQLAERYG
jgi:predicted AAA+ superfamily ATPase